jgi:hypothetical protein
MATRSIPTVSKRPVAMATASLVPTPSVPDTRTGRRYPAGSSKSPPKPPMAPSGPGRSVVEATRSLMPAMARSAASMSTPAWA